MMKLIHTFDAPVNVASARLLVCTVYDAFIASSLARRRHHVPSYLLPHTYLLPEAVHGMALDFLTYESRLASRRRARLIHTLPMNNVELDDSFHEYIDLEDGIDSAWRNLIFYWVGPPSIACASRLRDPAYPLRDAPPDTRLFRSVLSLPQLDTARGT